MAEVLRTVSIERRLFGPDVIPWTALLTESALERLRERYKLRILVQEQSPQAAAIRLVAGAGAFVLNGAAQTIEHLILEPALAHVQVVGTSEVADSFMEDLGTFLAELEPESDFSRELTRTYQTIATVKLRVPFDALFSTKLNDYMRTVVTPALNLNQAQAEVKLEHLSWSVRYKMETTDFSYIPKAITLEPRQGSPASESLYYTQSPTKSTEHLQLIEKLEESFAAE